jgi:hypothetical protein
MAEWLRRFLGWWCQGDNRSSEDSTRRFHQSEEGRFDLDGTHDWACDKMTAVDVKRMDLLKGLIDWRMEKDWLIGGWMTCLALVSFCLQCCYMLQNLLGVDKHLGGAALFILLAGVRRRRWDGGAVLIYWRNQRRDEEKTKRTISNVVCVARCCMVTAVWCCLFVCLCQASSNEWNSLWKQEKTLKARKTANHNYF